MKNDALIISEIIAKEALLIKRKITINEYHLLIRYSEEFKFIADNIVEYKYLNPIFKDDMQAAYLYVEGLSQEKNIKEILKQIELAESKLLYDIKTQAIDTTSKEIIEFKVRKKTYKKVD